MLWIRFLSSPGSRKRKLKTSYKYNTFCEKCFLCKLVVFCPSCDKCPQCCSKSACRGQTAPFLENMGHPRGQSQSHKNPQGRLHLFFWTWPTITWFPIIISGYVHPLRHSCLLEPLHTHAKRNINYQNTNISYFLQPTVLGSEAVNLETSWNISYKTKYSQSTTSHPFPSC